jgi:hypothetical protein
MAGSSDRAPVRDLDAEAEKALEAVEKAKTDYLAALTNPDSSAEIKELLKSDYTLRTQLAKTAAEAALLAKRQRAETLAVTTTATSSGTPEPSSEPDDLNPDLTTVTKRKRKELREIARQVGTPMGGWIDKQGKFHVQNAEHAHRLNTLLSYAWTAMDFIRSAEFLAAVNTYAESHNEFQAMVYETQDQLLSLLDELDWEAFGLRTKHEDGYAVYKCLMEGVNFHQDNPDRQKRLAVARKAANESNNWKRKSPLGTQTGHQIPPALRRTAPPHGQFHHNPRSYENNPAPGYHAPQSRGRGPRCFNCDQYGHLSRDCRHPPKPPRQ